MILTYKFRIKDSTVGKRLDSHSRAANYVWNFCCQTQREAQMIDTISRQDAMALGLLRFFTGRTCRNGHIAERLVSNHDCLSCLAERSRSRRANKPEEKAATNARYYAKNRDAVSTINANWRAANDSRMKKIRRNHYAANKGTYNARARMREVHIDLATPPWADLAKIRHVYETAARITAETGVSHEVDHISPLRAANSCGLHVHWNLRVITAEENRKKGNRVDTGLALPVAHRMIAM